MKSERRSPSSKRSARLLASRVYLAGLKVIKDLLRLYDFHVELRLNLAPLLFLKILKIVRAKGSVVHCSGYKQKRAIAFISDELVHSVTRCGIKLPRDEFRPSIL